MPAWSPTIASIILKSARLHGLAMDQMILQRLTYIAHGLRLALSGQPLTGDRPEAWDYGPVYRRIAEAAAHAGTDRLDHLACDDEDGSGVDQIERDLIGSVVHQCGALPMGRLSAITRGEGSPWKQVFDGGKGRFRDIEHRLIQQQFERGAVRLLQGNIAERSR